MKIQEVQFPLNIGSADELRIHMGEETENSINVHYVLLDTDQTTEMVGGQQIPYKALHSDKLVVTGNDYVSYGNLAGLFIEAIKEQQTQIEELKQLVNQLINK